MEGANQFLEAGEKAVEEMVLATAAQVRDDQKVSRQKRAVCDSSLALAQNDSDPSASPAGQGRESCRHLAKGRHFRLRNAPASSAQDLRGSTFGLQWRTPYERSILSVYICATTILALCAEMRFLCSFPPLASLLSLHVRRHNALLCVM